MYKCFAVMKESLVNVDRSVLFKGGVSEMVRRNERERTDEVVSLWWS